MCSITSLHNCMYSNSVSIHLFEKKRPASFTENRWKKKSTSFLIQKCPKVASVYKVPKSVLKCPKASKQSKSVQICQEVSKIPQRVQSRKISLETFFWDTLYFIHSIALFNFGATQCTLDRTFKKAPIFNVTKDTIRVVNTGPQDWNSLPRNINFYSKEGSIPNITSSIILLKVILFQNPSEKLEDHICLRWKRASSKYSSMAACSGAPSSSLSTQKFLRIISR